MRDNPNFLDVSQVSTRFGVSPETIRKHIERGLLQAHNFGTRNRAAWRIDPTSLPAYLKTLRERHPGATFLPDGISTPEDDQDERIETRAVD